MVFRKFTIGVIARLVLLVALIVASVLIWIVTDWLFTQLLVSAMVAGVLIELLHFITKTNKDLAKFIDAINYQDYQVSFSSYKWGNAFDELHSSFQSTIELFRQLKIEKEAHYQYLTLLVKQVRVGIVSFAEDGTIALYNQMAESILGVPNLKQWDRYGEIVPRLFERVRDFGGVGKQTVLLGNGKELSVYVNRMKTEGNEFTMVVFQDIGAEIEDKELKAWNQLIKILTHEIMNSVTPIVSLTDTLLQVARKEENPDIAVGLETIQRRSTGLLQFVEDYRKLTSLPSPNRRQVNLVEFVKHVFELYEKELQTRKIEFVLSVPGVHLLANMDEVLMEQVLINLLSNASFAVEHEETPKIELGVRTEGENPILYVKDNGHGISQDRLGEIFVPFFSTRDNGSGIGLSLAKQIVHQHGGSLKVKSDEGQGTLFTIHL